MNLFDIMRGAGGGSAYPNFARLYGLPEDQFAKVVEAFLPAFSFGVKRSTADPLGIFELMRRLAAGDYARFYADPMKATSSGVGPGQDMLAFLFGPEAVRQAVARQIAAFSGVDYSKLFAEIMPALTAIMSGGLFQQALAAGNPFAEGILRRMRPAESSKAGSGPKGPLDRHEEEQERRAAMPGADFARISQEMMQSGLSAMAAGSNAWLDMLEQISKGAMPRPAPEKPHISGMDVFGEMLEPGLRFGEAYQRELEAIFERFRPKASA